MSVANLYCRKEVNPAAIEFLQCSPIEFLNMFSANSVTKILVITVTGFEPANSSS